MRRKYASGFRMASAAFLLALGIFGAAGRAAAQPAAAPSETRPVLEIPVPGIEFSGIIRENELITIPWLAQYIAGAYTFLISIAGLAAAVMMIVGGFQYVTSAGDKGRIAAARTRMVNAFIGLLLAFGSYTILYAINPGLVSFEGLKIIGVKTDVYDAHMATTLVATALDNPAEEPAGPPAGMSGEKPGSFTHQFTTCPFTLPKGQFNAPITANICASTWKDKKPKRCAKDADCPLGDTCAGKVAFYKQIRESGAVTKTNVREKVVQIADIADACNVNLGSCGEFAGTVSALAGLDDGKCLNPPNQRGYSCNDHGRGKQKRGITQKQRQYTYGQRCEIPVEYPDYITKMKKGPEKDAKMAEFAVTWREKNIRKPCYHTTREATAELRRYLKEQNIKGWPDEWADQLRPGDYVTVYNGNTDLVGSHALIFVGWAQDGKSMQVIQGGGGGSGANTDRARPGAICIRSSCGDSQIPLLRIYSPD